jgi:hypothetical protein
VIPEFYTRNEKGIPTAWVARMRESMARLTPRFSADRAVREYTEQHYLPAAAAYRSRVANKGAVGKQMVDWRHSLEQKWATLRFGEVKVETRRGNTYLRFKYLMASTPRRCGWSFMPTESTAASGAAGDDLRSPLAGRIRRLRLQRDGVCGPPASGLYGASDAALRRRSDSTGRRTNPMATMMKHPNASCTIISRRSPSTLTFGPALPAFGNPGKGRRS